MTDDGSNWEILSPPGRLPQCGRPPQDGAHYSLCSGSLHHPPTYVKLTGKQADQMLRLMDELEDHDDVEHVQFDIEESELQALTQAK